MTGFQDPVNTAIAQFISKSKTNIALYRDWWYLPIYQEGLGLTRVGDMVHSLQVHMLYNVILTARTHLVVGIPTWSDPVIRLFDQAIQTWGRDFDILYDL